MNGDGKRLYGVLLATMWMVVSINLHGQPVAPGMAVVFGVVAATSLGLMFWYLKGLSGDLSTSTNHSIGQP